MSIYLESSHETLTNQLPACHDGGAFSETTEGALFLPGAKDERSPLKRGGFLVPATPPSGSIEGRVLVTVGGG